jgi:alpha,alpha-trehalose phosphorylase
VTGDRDFERDVGVELLVATARLWATLGHFGKDGRFRIDGVTGPDEYSALVDNNVYTNLMAQANLRAAADAVGRHPEVAQALHVSGDEAGSWRAAANAVSIPYDGDLGIHPQDQDFLLHERWDFEKTGPDRYPLLLHYTYFDLYRKQVVKQADLVLAIYKQGAAFSEAEKRRDFDYYEGLTVRDSSLSASVQGIVAAEVGHLGLAHDYLGEAALMDLHDLEHNIRDGLHIASLAGAVLGVLAGFGGLREVEGHLSFSPRLPEGVTRLAFRVAVEGRRLLVEAGHESARYVLEKDGKPVTIVHWGESLELRPGAEETRPIPHLEAPHPPNQPPHRAPATRGGRRPAKRGSEQRRPHAPHSAEPGDD